MSVSRSGERTIAHGFQQAAMSAIESQVYWTMAAKMKQALERAGNPQIQNAARDMFNLVQAAEDVF